MDKFKAGDKVKVVKSGLCTYWYANRIGDVFTLSSQISNGDWRGVEDRDGWLSTSDIELVKDEKETISEFLRGNKWFIRTGSPEESKLVQEWLFEHGMEWIYGKNVQSRFNEQLLTNTDCVGEKGNFIMFSTDLEKKNAQEIKLTFKTIVESVEIPVVESKEEAERKKKIQELKETIALAQKQLEEME